MAYEYDERYPEQFHPIANYIAIVISRIISKILAIFGR